MNQQIYARAVKDMSYGDIHGPWRHQSNMSSKKLSSKATLRQVFIRVYRLEIQSVMLIFSPCRSWPGASETEASQSGIEPGTSCTAGEHSMQRAIRMALLTAIRNLGLYYYNSPPIAMSLALDWGSWLSLTRTRIYLIGRVEVRIAREGASRSNHCWVRGSRVLEPQNCVRNASRRGHHYVGAWQGPLTSSA
jgi:hypothetical protein